MESKSVKVNISIKVISLQIKNMDMDICSSSIQKIIKSILVNGWMDLWTAMESKFIIQAKSIKENLNSASGMESAPFIMINKNHMVTMVNFMMGLNMEKVIKYFSMEINIQAHFLKTSFMVKASTNGKMEPNTKGLFIKVKNMVKVCWF